jgi:hypothetical protein
MMVRYAQVMEGTNRKERKVHKGKRFQRDLKISSCSSFNPGHLHHICDILKSKSALHKCGMFFVCRDVPWNVSTRGLNICNIVFIPKISNTSKSYTESINTKLKSYPVNPLILDILIQTKIYFPQRHKGAKAQRRYPVHP